MSTTPGLVLARCAPACAVRATIRVSAWTMAAAVLSCSCNESRSPAPQDAGADAWEDVAAADAADGTIGEEVPDASAWLPALSTEALQALETSSQLLAVVTPGWADPSAKVALFERQSDSWALSFGPMDAQVGSKGLSWGRGLTLPQGAGRIKAEGDKTAPAGILRLGMIMGYGAQPPAGLQFPYQQSTAQTLCVDDPASTHYNSIIVDASAVAKDWTSAETMLRPDNLYSLLAVIDHNGLTGEPAPVPGAGSCIFLHLWSGPGHPTIGCTAMDGEHLTSLLVALQSPDKVVLVQLPAAEYEAAVQHWHLPPMP